MVIICFFFGCQKWFPYEADALIPYINHSPRLCQIQIGRALRESSFTASLKASTRIIARGIRDLLICQ